MSNLRKIVFDIETSNLFSEVGSNDPSALSLSVISIYDYESDKYQSFFEDELNKLWPILEKSDMLIGYNSNHFDIPLLNKYYPGDLTKIKSLDILHEIRSSYGRRMKLDQVAEATLGENKITNGLEATKWWKQGLKDKVVEYCEQDVKITKEVYEYAIANNHLKFKEGGEIINIPLDTSNWEKEESSTLTHTLPF
jgi:DEAD/DEAH box helicase domain-containing protein